MNTEEQIEQEIQTLSASPLVALARKEQRNKYLKQQRLYQLRWMEKRGRELADAGVTMETLRAQTAELRAELGNSENPGDDALW